MTRNRIRFGVSVTLLCLFALSCSGGVSQQQDSLDSPGNPAVYAVGWDILKLNSYNYADTELDRYGHFKTVPNACRQDAAGAINIGLWNRIVSLVNRGLTVLTLDDPSKLCFTRSENSKLFGTVDAVYLIPAPQALLLSAPTPAPAPTPIPMISFPWPWNPAPSHTPEPTVTPSVIPTHTPTPTITPSTRPSPSPSPSASPVSRTILENNGNQICTKMNDQKLAQDLVDALDELAAIAYREDCERAP